MSTVLERRIWGGTSWAFPWATPLPRAKPPLSRPLAETLPRAMAPLSRPTAPLPLAGLPAEASLFRPAAPLPRATPPPLPLVVATPLPRATPPLLRAGSLPRATSFPPLPRESPLSHATSTAIAAAPAAAALAGPGGAAKLCEGDLGDGVRCPEDAERADAAAAGGVAAPRSESYPGGEACHGVGPGS
jgi:hypothetical protein